MNNRLNPAHPISGLENHTVSDYWSWAYSDILTNTNRSVFAEYLVGAALGVLDTPRIEWDRYDLFYREVGIEVKSSAYVQSWYQECPSKIQFDIAKKLRWDYTTNSYEPDYPCRCADCYVFCLFTGEETRHEDVLDTSLWRFYVLPTTRINGTFGEQKSVAFSRIEEVCEPVLFRELKRRVDSVIGVG